MRSPMQLFSFLGSEEFYLFIAPFLYWCIDQSLGLRLAIGLMVSNWINLCLKQVLLLPRPYWISRQVNAWASESSFSLPSGHAQNAVVVWGLLAASVRRWWCWLLAIFLIFMIGDLTHLFGSTFSLGCHCRLAGGFYHSHSVYFVRKTLNCLVPRDKFIAPDDPDTGCLSDDAVERVRGFRSPS